jgi:hypothetical protein
MHQKLIRDFTIIISLLLIGAAVPASAMPLFARK